MQPFAEFRPQWHHIFLRKHLEGKVNNGLVDDPANTAVIGPRINIRIRAKDPMNYVTGYGITAEKLAQQFIDPGLVSVGRDSSEA